MTITSGLISPKIDYPPNIIDNKWKLIFIDMKLLDSIIEFEKVFGRSGHDIGTMQINITSSESCNLETLYDILNFSKPLTIGGELFMHIYPKDMLIKQKHSAVLLFIVGVSNN